MGRLNCGDNANSGDKIIRTPDLEYTPDPGGMGKIFFSQMSSAGEAIAQATCLAGLSETDSDVWVFKPSKAPSSTGARLKCSQLPEHRFLILVRGGVEGETPLSYLNRASTGSTEIDGLTGDEDSYSSLLQRCVRTAITMRSRGITPDDIVTLCSFNHLNSCVPFISALFLGCRVASLDPTISLSDTIHLLKQVHPKMLFVAPEAVQLIENSLREADVDAEVVVFGDSSSYSNFLEFLEPSDQEKEFAPVEAESLKDTAVMFFSSGTTGLPKAICLNHFGLLSQSYQLIEVGFNTTVCSAFASLYWISSALFLTCGILTKGCRVVVPRFDPNTIWQLIENFKVSIMFLAPIQAIAMYKKGRPEGIDTTHLCDLLLGGGPVAKEQMEEIRDILPGTNVSLGYGQTELSGCGTCFHPGNPKDMLLSYERAGSSGRPLQGLSYKVVDTETEENLGPNQRGELRIKTEFQMNGYYNMDSSDAWDCDGFLKTGDVVYYDEDYCFYIVDRVKEMLKFQSWHVPPAKLEGILLMHPAIQAAVVIGIHDPEDGDHPMGVVVLKPSAVGSVSEEDIVNYVEKRVDDRQGLRAGVKFISNVPLTPSGKPKRRVIRDMVLQGKI